MRTLPGMLLSWCILIAGHSSATNVSLVARRVAAHRRGAGESGTRGRSVATFHENRAKPHNPTGFDVSNLIGTERIGLRALRGGSHVDRRVERAGFGPFGLIKSIGECEPERAGDVGNHVGAGGVLRLGLGTAGQQSNPAKDPAGHNRSTFARAPKRTDTQIEKNEHDPRGEHKRIVIRTMGIAGADAPKSRAKNDDGQEEENARDFEP